MLSGNRNFEGRINPDVRNNYLASPPLCVAYALAGRMDVDLTSEPLGEGSDGEPVYLSDIWPSSEEIKQTVAEAVRADMFTQSYADVFTGDDRWRALDTPEGDRYTWPDSTYVRKPPFFDGMDAEPQPVEPIEGARVLAVLGDSVTTDHISPAGAIKKQSPAGQWLIDNGVEPARVQLVRLAARQPRGDDPRHVRERAPAQPARRPRGRVHAPLPRRRGDDDLRGRDELRRRRACPLVVLAGKEYGSGSSRDWAAKGTALLGVRAVIAESFERIHRSNLIGMGVLPLQLPDGDTIESLGLTGEETFDVGDLENGDAKTVTVTAKPDGGDEIEFEARVRLDTPNEVLYFQNGGILHRVLRDLR